jgi:hypothetical protein
MRAFIDRIERRVRGIDIRDGRIDDSLLRDDVNDENDKRIDVPISSIDDFDASLTPSVPRTLARSTTTIERDAITH